MTELKTLKEIPNAIDDPKYKEVHQDNTVFRGTIKKEAIKWANHLDKIDDNIREFIKKFFNITSEDLK